MASVVQLPMGDVGVPGFVMTDANGRDQVAVKAATDGWWSFEQPLPALLLRLCQKRPGLLVDVGANTGFYSLLAVAAESGMNVHAFEPDPDVRSYLFDNINRNGFADRIAVESCALSDKIGTAKLYIPLQGHGLVETSSSLNADFKPAHSAEIVVEVSTLDDRLVDSSSISIIKIDVEGHEQEALAGGIASLAKHRPYVVVELLGTANFAFFDEICDRYRYTAFKLRADQIIKQEAMSFDILAWNHVLVPKEREEEFQEVLEDLRLQLVT